MKIVLLYLGRRGAGPLYSIEFAKSLILKGINVLAIVSSYSENIKEWRRLSNKYETKNFLLQEIPTYKSKKEFACNSFNIKLFHFLITSIRRYSPDYILSTMVHPWHNIIFAFLGKSIRRIKIIHDVLPHKGEDSFIFRMLNKMDIYISDLWIVLTNIAKEQLIEKGIEKEKICVIPHANFGGYANDSIVLSKTILYRIAFIGRISKYKGLDILLNAFLKIRSDLPNLKLIVAGSGDCGEYASSIEKLGESIELKNRWITDEEMSQIIENVDFVVLPYIEATQSGVIPLAFAFGKTVIATNVGGISEQVPQDIGILIPPHDSLSLGNAILNLYREPDKIIEMGHSAFRYAQNELSWVHSAELFMEFCNLNQQGA